MNNTKKILVSKIILVIVAVIVTIPVIIYLPEILKLTVSVDKFRDFILSTGNLGPIIFILFQVLQTVVAPIPGEVVQIAGGYIYGVFWGTFYTTFGMLLGAIIAFYFTRFLGRSFVESLLEKKKSRWMANMLDDKKLPIYLFIIFIIPGLPKDMFIYAAGLTPIKPMKFFTILVVGRFPWLLASVSIGSNLYAKDYVMTIVISVISVIGFVVGLIYKDKLMDKLLKFSRRKKETS